MICLQRRKRHAGDDVGAIGSDKSHGFPTRGEFKVRVKIGCGIASILS
jgi:hypothetical protein